MANPDLILFNGSIYPRPSNSSKTEALAIWNGRVTRMGSDSEILKLKAPSVKKVNLRGRAVIPGLIDSHVHLLGYGLLSRELDLGRAGSIRELRLAVEGGAREKSKGWILGRGWDQEKLREHRMPTRQDLDLTTRPVFLKRICGHVAVANTAALSLSGVGEDTVDPPGGVIDRDAEGHPTGLLKENALELVQRKITRNERDIEETLVLAAKRLLNLGLTSLQCIIGDRLEFKILRRLKAAGRVRQSIYAIPTWNINDKETKSRQATSGHLKSFRVIARKIFLDGSLGARTAALNKPYSDSPSSGMLTTTREDFEEIVEEATHEKVQLAIHAIGDRAVDMAADVLSKADNDGMISRLRHRIEHASLISGTALKTIRKHGILMSVQPPFIFTDTWAKERLGRKRLSNLYPFRSMVEARLRVAAGSDSPAASPDPFLGVWSAVFRPGLPQNERLTASQALGWYTEGSAYASFSENDEGMLEPGKRANLIVLSRDPFNCTRDEVRGVRATRTMIDGEFVSE